MSEENTTAPSEETPVIEPTAEPVVEETPETATHVEKECNHPSNTTGNHQNGKDNTCIYCGH